MAPYVHKLLWPRVYRTVKNAAYHTIKNTGRAFVAHGVKKVGAYAYNRLTTKTKGKESIPVNVTQHADLSEKIISFSLGKAKKYEKYQGFETLYEQYSSTILNRTGYQGNFEMTPTAVRDQFMSSNTGSGLLKTYSYEVSTNAFDLNPMQRTTGSNVITVAAGPLGSDVTHLRNVVHEITICNMTAGVPAVAEILWLKCKKNTNIGPLNLWNDATANYGTGQSNFSAPPTTVDSGASQVVGYPNFITSGAPNFDVVGAAETLNQVTTSTTGSVYGTTPLALPEFRKFWKLVHREKVELQAGDQKRYLVKIGMHKTIQRAWLVDTPQRYLAGYSVVPIVIYRPGVIDWQPIETQSRILPGTVKIGWMCNSKFNYCMPKAAASRFNVIRAAPQFPDKGMGVNGFNSSSKIIIDTDTVVTGPGNA